MNAGKQFENDFKASILDDQFFLRLPDGGGWSNAENTRFTPSNLCDCILFTGKILYLLELKSHKGKSIPASALKQVEPLASINTLRTIPAFLCNFRDVGETWLVGAETVRAELETRKSLSIQTCREYGLHIPQKKLRVHWRYDLSVL
jgi:recombination protein U